MFHTKRLLKSKSIRHTRKWRFLLTFGLGLILYLSVQRSYALSNGFIHRPLNETPTETLNSSLNLLNPSDYQSRERRLGIQNISLSHIDKLRPLITQNQAPSLYTLLEEGIEFYQNQQFEEAIAVWSEVLQRFDLQENSAYQSVLWTYTSLAYQDLGEWEKARAAIATSLDLIQNHLDRNSEQKQLLAQALTARGRLELLLGQAEIALETWRLSTRFYQEINDEIGKMGSLINQALALESLGYYRRSCTTLLVAIGLPDSCQALALQDIESLVIHFEDIIQSHAELGILGLRNLGNILRSLGYLARSRQVLEQALNITADSGTTQAQIDTLLSLGTTEYVLYQQAKDLYERTKIDSDRAQVVAVAQQALDRYQAIISNDDVDSISRISIIQARLQKLRLLRDLQNWDQTNDSSIDTDSLQSDLQIQIHSLLNENLTALPPSQTAIYIQLNFAKTLVQTDLDWINTSIQMTQLAVQQAEMLNNRRSQSYALGTLGELYEQVDSIQPGYLAIAQHNLEEALSLAQSIQAWDIAYQWQWRIGRLSSKQGDHEQAIVYYQASVETLRSVRKNLVATETDFQFSFRDTVEPIYRELVTLLLQEQEGNEPTQLDLRQAVRAIDDLQLSELENFLRCDLTPSIDIDEVQIDLEAAIIHTIILDKQLAVVLKLPTSDQLYLHTIPLLEYDINQTLIELKSELTHPYTSPRSLALSQEVYRWLIYPIESDLELNHIKTLVFILDGEFRSVPMAALHDGERYLVEGYAVAITPGLQLLQPYPLRRLSLQGLTFGLSKTRKGFTPHSGFTPLENVETEVQTIQNSISGQALLNENFTSSAMRRQIRTSSAPIVHLATHGQFSSNPNETFVLAWDERVNVNDLGAILQSRSLNNPNPLELLVLSACETANGDSRAALGLAGIAVQSGARSTIASLWSINDDSTAKLMGFFYQELTRSDVLISKAEALRNAQVQLLNSPGYRAPLFWAPYVLIGNWL